jgi:hypothetical protein
MALLYLIFVALIVLTVGIGYLAYRGSWGAVYGPSAVARRTAAKIGNYQAAALFAVVGAGVTFPITLGLGYLAKALQSSVDERVFNYVYYRVDKTGRFGEINAKLTNFGLNSNVQLVCIVAVLTLAVIYRRRWYLAPILIVGMFYLERYYQRGLASIVDRGAPPTSLGTFPSGGVARILAVYGTILVLIICIAPTLSRAWRAGIWTALALMAIIEAYTRVYLSLHWFTDALFALPFGALLCVTAIMVVQALNQRSAGEETSVPAASTSRVHAQA